MLPSSHQERLEQFKQFLEEIRSVVNGGEAAGDVSGVFAESLAVHPKLKSAIGELQQFFQTQILSLDTNNLAPKVEHQIQSYQVEMDKQLRLLEMDRMFWQVARQPATGSQRQEQMSDRLVTLMRYCDLLLVSRESEETEWAKGDHLAPRLQ